MRSVTRIGPIQIGQRNDGHNSHPQRPAALGFDPALLSVEQIETQLVRLNDRLGDDLADIAQGECAEVQAITSSFKALKDSLGGCQSRHVINASAILSEALELTAAIISQGHQGTDINQWQKGTARWRKTMSSLLSRATQLRSFAARQPGYGFGSLLDSPALRTADANSSSYERVLIQRHQRLPIARTAMSDARSNMDKTADMQVQTQAKIIEMTEQMRELHLKQDIAAETKQVLRKSMDVLDSMRAQVQELTRFFNGLADIINIVCKGHAEQYLRAIDAGVTTQGGSDHFAMAYSEQQLQAIRETIITLRGHFGFFVHSADLYQEVATAHINPCIRMAAALPLSASPDEQEIAKQTLNDMTSASATAITRLAERETKKYVKDFENRVQEIERELDSLELPPPRDDDENLKSTESGVKEASSDIATEIEEAFVLFEEIVDELRLDSSVQLLPMVFLSRFLFLLYRTNNCITSLFPQLCSTWLHMLCLRQHWDLQREPFLSGISA